MGAATPLSISKTISRILCEILLTELLKALLAYTPPHDLALIEKTLTLIQLKDARWMKYTQDISLVVSWYEKPHFL